MTSKEYTLTDVSDSLEGLYDMAVYLNSGSYTKEISEKIIHHLHDKIVDLQGMVNFIRIAPELQESKPQN